MKHLLLRKKQFILYCFIGASGVSLDFMTYSLLVKLKLLDYQMANATGYVAGTLLSFILNARFNFRVTDKIPKRMVSFFSVAFLGWLVSAGVLYVLIGHWGLGKYVSKMFTLIIVVMLQYNLNRLVSFRRVAS